MCLCISLASKGRKNRTPLKHQLTLKALHPHLASTRTLTLNTFRIKQSSGYVQQEAISWPKRSSVPLLFQLLNNRLCNPRVISPYNQKSWAKKKESEGSRCKSPTPLWLMSSQGLLNVLMKPFSPRVLWVCLIQPWPNVKRVIYPFMHRWGRRGLIDYGVKWVGDGHKSKMKMNTIHYQTNRARWHSSNWQGAKIPQS